MLEAFLDILIIAQEGVYQYFDYNPEWEIFPIEDYRKNHWFISNNTLVFSEAPFTFFLIQNFKYCTSTVLETYDKPDFTMLKVDTETDGNIVLGILENKLKVTDPDIINYFQEVQ